MADNAPNFDAMTPEEIMAWMESLAKRQGADSAGFTTAADIDIPEVDPDSVVIDEPGYIPSEGKDRGKRIGPGVPIKSTAPAASAPATKPAAATPAPAPAKPAVSTPPPPPATAPVAQPAAKVPPPVTQPPAPAVKTPPPAPAAQPAAAQLPIFKEPEPAIEAPDWLANLGIDNELPPEPVEDEPEVSAPSLSWLESLAVDSSSALPEFDLSSLGKELETSAPTPATAETNPVNWLESLSQNQEDITPVASANNPVNWLESLAQEQGVQDAPAPAAANEDDAVNWLESLAKRQGARSEELTTEADLNLPPMVTPSTPAQTGYSNYTFDSPVPPAKSEPPKQPSPFAASAPADPAAWLDSLASQAFESSKPQAAPPQPAREMSDNDIQQALKRGELVPPEQMEAWMQRQLKEGASRPEPEELSGDYDPDAPPVKADLPDWLIEQVGDAMPFDEPATAAPAIPAAQTPALIDTILEPPTVMDMPDWLKDDEPSSDELDSIFATPAPENWAETRGFTTPDAPVYETQTSPSNLIDPNDPWVEALEMEYVQAHGGTKEVTEQTPPDAVPPMPTPTPVISTTTTLQSASLPPETEVPAGQPDAVPDWLSSVTGEQAIVAEPEPSSGTAMPDWLTMEITEPQAAASDVPDWLRDVNVEADDIPDWLKQTITSTKDDMVVTPAQTPAPAAITPAAPPPMPAIVPVRASPAPVPVAAQNIDVAATLQSARTHATGNNLDASLPNYEMLIRANAVLDDVADDLGKMVDKFKTNPAVYRVLGDTLMRQGKLQAALDTYRKALNQL